MRDPLFFAVQYIAAVCFNGLRAHMRRVRAAVRFRQAERADQLARSEAGQVFFLLFVGAEFRNRQHHKRRLNGKRGAVSAVDALELSCNEAVGNGAGPASVFRNAWPQQAERAHFL